MIEGKSTVAAVPIPLVPAPSLGAVKAQDSANKHNEIADKVDVKALSKAEPAEDVKVAKLAIPAAKLEGAVSSINEYVQSVQRDIHFSVDEDLNQTVVKVVDSGSGELIRQIPGEVFLEMARKLKEGGEFRMVDATG